MLAILEMAMMTGDDAPAIFRGPMVSKYIRLFIAEVAWGQLDYLILDLPPGTGDTQLTRPGRSLSTGRRISAMRSTSGTVDPSL
jgi:Mrp family chromosome partitioning ATPase